MWSAACGRERQTLQSRERAGLLSSMLILVVIALLLPAVFDLSPARGRRPARTAGRDEELSLGVSAVLLLLYAANLVYTLVTHRDVFAREEREADGRRLEPGRSLGGDDRGDGRDRPRGGTGLRRAEATAGKARVCRRLSSA